MPVFSFATLNLALQVVLNAGFFYRVKLRFQPVDAIFAVPENFEPDDEYEDVLSADWREYGDDGKSLEGLGKFIGLSED